MRKHLYRAYSKSRKAVYDVATITFNPDGVRVLYLLDNASEGQKGITTDDFEDVELLEYIGIADRFGKDIYEGDILHLRLGNDLLEVRWSVFGYRFFNLEKQDWQMVWAADLKRLEVVGTVYESPKEEVSL